MRRIHAAPTQRKEKSLNPVAALGPNKDSRACGWSSDQTVGARLLDVMLFRYSHTPQTHITSPKQRGVVVTPDLI
ncbi:uncharacterized protein H6S33_007689 [Morchella sextelata]|uniref:uncharacterized protein n=1 Tax=Morchella sextelata TaxID=1174677 RepID=UPI001D053DBE|nr:uncharacterized protein H6S33_007689 [Morchella sextelata]KAH0603367.1 hypothetical protein H6S33_007689 [Morchella sextelata]